MTEVLTRDLVVVPGEARTRDEAIREAGELLVGAGAVTPAYVDAMLERESTVSTFMGNGLAIPHGTNEAKAEISRSAVCLVRYDEPIDWGGSPVRVVVGIAGQGDSHLEILGRIAVLFSDEAAARSVLEAPDADAVYTILGQVNA
ncbi:PTS mannitol transporter subunit IIA [Xylanimonas oleitrophica]|uniref:Mannitol-specific phosphotransferase enzyme IIA component n=1 Tax=Xylanimonas oleitrophica TaxID=2607479 RepID=A0A2W5WTX7_9MICO|nr:PTS sugar transporter subunit IIA [Xylanimonas oleitrophica]PZR54919.1 PTS mannitol transporter subunit IIA [Xylanimonas oleitrophica]